MMPSCRLASELRSQISQVFQVTSHIVGLFALPFASPIQSVVAVSLCSISYLYANSLKSFTLRKRSCEVLSLQDNRRANVFLVQHQPKSFHLVGIVLMGELAESRLCGFALAFDRLAKSPAFNF